MPEEAPLPFLWGVLYGPPNHDGSQKKCGNCAFWVKDFDRCILHKKSLVISQGMVCGYHVEGNLSETRPFNFIEPLDPALSGLEDTGRLNGTSCGSCRFFEYSGGHDGLCHGVAAKAGEPPAQVQILGCCGRWEAAS